MLFLAARALYSKMENLEEEFENKMEKIHVTVVRSVGTGTIEKWLAFNFRNYKMY